MNRTYCNKALMVFSGLVLAMQLASCVSTQDTEQADASAPVNSQPLDADLAEKHGDLTSALANQAQSRVEGFPIQGDLEFLNTAEGEAYDIEEFRKVLEAEERPSGIVLNFEGADIKRVIEMVIGKILNENYLIDPAVQGTITLKTEKPLNRDTVFYMLENVLDIYGARISKRKGHYRIYPKDQAGLSMLGYGDTDARIKLGYGYRIVPLDYVSADEMVKILKSVTIEDTVIRADDTRNLIILGGTSENVRNMMQAIDMFDVDWMQGTNVGLIKINFSDVNDVLEDLKKMLAVNETEMGNGGVLTLETIERLNSILVITRQNTYLQRVRTWARKLDVPSEGAGNNLYVYPVKNLTAEELAGLLNELFAEQTDDGEIVAEDENLTGPGSVPATMVSNNKLIEFETEAPPFATDSLDDTKPKGKSSINIVAVSATNSLLIFTTPGQYAKIEVALEKLDVPPLQVLIEVTIMDVALKDEFSYGMQWFIEHGDGGDGSSAAVIGDSLSFAQTFSFAGVWGDVRVLLGLLASDGRVKVLSSPSILVRNHHKASIRVGDQQPISTAVINETGTVIASSVTYRDTGILLDIQPSITSSGTINVELSQEVTDVGDIDAATGQRTFLNRNLNTTVSVRNGETIILGGLIRSNQAVSKSGVPGLRDIPGIGFLFGKTVTADARTELLMIMSPRIIRNPQESNEVLNEYKSKFKNLDF
jgi:general secretion pathway protein D